MPRVSNSAPRRKRHKKLLKFAKGYWGARSRVYRTARNAVEKGWQYNYRDRRQRKRFFRRLWITRINAAARLNNTTYRDLIMGLKAKNINLDRKMLADLAVRNPEAFSEVVNSAVD